MGGLSCDSVGNAGTGETRTGCCHEHLEIKYRTALVRQHDLLTWTFVLRHVHAFHSIILSSFPPPSY